MALAALYANLRSSEPKMAAPHAFIVDHKVRPESTEEAEWVAHQCRSKCRTHAMPVYVCKRY